MEYRYWNGNKPANCQYSAEFSGRKYVVDAPINIILRGPGIARHPGYNAYLLTPKAYEKLCKSYDVALDIG